ncbi:MAG: NAD(P)/FAD-dependent oxidoreductase [Anaerolineae bacterium]|nr:NAD(P)/FAD-dependent oxidoreductase [Anaerolineae bacterium]
MHIAVVGGGLTGMTAAQDLAQAGHQVALFERDSVLGGLAGSFEVGGTLLERFYHHIFTSDRSVLDLIIQLGLGENMEWKPTTTSYYADRVYRLAAPIDVLRFRPLPFLDRIRFGMLVFQARFVGDWRPLEGMTAKEWLIRLSGRRVYEQVWAAMLRGKFGDRAEEISAVWIWNKVKLRGGSRGKSGQERLGYLRGGFGLMVEALEAKLAGLGVAVHKDSPVEVIEPAPEGGFLVRSDGGSTRYDQVLVTTAPELLAEMTPGLPANYRQQLRSIEYMANVCCVLDLDRSLSEVYWLNISDNRIPFVGLVEHTNIQGPERYGGSHLVYLTRYCDPLDEYYTMSDDELVKAYLPHIQRIFPQFRPEWVRRSYVWRERYAQPVIARHYSRLRPDFATPLPGLWLGCMAQIYPEDRGMNYAVEYGHLVAQRILSDGGTHRV